MDVREFIFFDNSDSILFTRTDAESANWQVDELNLTCLFPYVPEKTITRGMRIAFDDDDGVLQPFEVRKVRNYEPDRYQEITCEHIVISELTDIHTGEQELTDASPSSALSSILSAQPNTITGAKRWAVGNVTATNTSSGDISMGSVWQNIRNIETNWNVYILPRVTWSANGITGRYLDIVPASGVWHGFRLSIDKNADELGVTVDDTEVKTALYGYGGNSYTYTTDNLDKTKTPINLVGYTWPGKPSGASINSTLGYIEDTAATAAYGRNGQPRFGFFQNGDIADQATLAQKTWEALQTTNKPIVTVDCMVRDLYRMGYHDEKIRLHDTVMVELLPMNDVLQLEIIKLAVDLLDPTATRPTIGEYVPNIVYIQRQTAETASGGAGRGISGRRGGETETEAKWSEFQAEFVVNNAIMSYHAVQVDHDNKVLKAAGMDIDAQGVIIYAEDNVNQIGSKFKATADAITQEVTDRSNADTTLTSSIQQEADKIALVVTSTTDPETGVVTNSVNGASLILAINKTKTGKQTYSSAELSADLVQLKGGSSTVTLDDKIVIDTDGYTKLVGHVLVANASYNPGYTVEANNGKLTAHDVQIRSNGALTFTGSGDQEYYALSVGNSTTNRDIKNVVTGFGTVTSDATTGEIFIPYNTVYRLGTLQNQQYINFNMASMKYFQDSMEAVTPTSITADKISTSYATVKLNPTMKALNAADETLITQALQLERNTYDISATSSHRCVNLKLGSDIIGRISVQTDYTDGIAVGEGNVRITSVDGTDQGDPSSNVNPASITATASNGATYTRSLYLTQGSWNSNNQKAVNIRVGTTFGDLIGRIWINAPSVNVGTPYLNQPAQGKIRAVCVVNGQTYYGATHNLSEYS